MGLKPRSIKGKIFAIILPPVVVSYLIVSLIAGVLAYYDKKNEIIDHYNDNATTYIKPLGLFLWNLNHSVIDSQLKSMLNNPDISGVKVVEYLSEQTFEIGDIPSEDQLSDYLTYKINIEHVSIDAPEVLGTLHLFTKKDIILDVLVNRFLRDSFLFLILIVTVIFSAMYANNEVIVVPLQKLIKSIRIFRTPEDFKPVEWKANDEIGEVISAYNGLIISLEMGNSQIKYALKKAEDANRIKSEFLANMSHEIRTPLNGIMGISELMLEMKMDRESKNLLNTINMESESLLTIINDILDFSKIEAGKLEFENIPFDLRHTLENLCASLSINANKKGIELIHYLDSEANSNLLGDPGRLRQIFVNLIGNGIKFTNEGEVFVKGELIEDFDHKTVYLFTVKDTGIGIPKEKQDEVFDSFSQADGSTTREFGGTGLGITISKMLVEQMGGTIGLKSEPGEGTEFWFELEFFKQASDTIKKEAIHTDFQGLKVLVVDDIKNNRDILRKYLESWGCQVLSSSSGQSGLKRLEETIQNEIKIDVIITDFQMPRMDGFEFATQIKGMPAYKDTPMIMLTSMGTIGDGKECKRIGIDGYLTKPIRHKDLKAFISHVLGQTKELKELPKNLVTRHTLAEAKRMNIHILLAEDYETNQKLATRQLESSGFHVTLAQDGKQAVKHFLKQKFDIILMDIQMPVMDGYEATSQIRELEKSEISKSGIKTPIIAMTAHAIQGYREQCLEAGMDDYITKPLKKEVLLSTVSKWIQNKQEVKESLNFYVENPKYQLPKKKLQILDMDAAIEEFGGDEAFFNEVLFEFIDVVGNQLNVLKDAMAKNDKDSIAKEAHSIKGGAANLLAEILSKKAALLEDFANSDTMGDPQKKFEELSEAFTQLKEFTKTLNKDL